jgi:hypothetical protein
MVIILSCTSDTARHRRIVGRAKRVPGPQGGFRRVCFAEAVFAAAELGRDFDIGALPEGVVTVEDLDLEWLCPQCGATLGQRCNGASKR